MGDKLDHVVRSQRVSNKALRDATNWRPRFPSVREGIPAVVKATETSIGRGDGPVPSPEALLEKLDR